MIKDNYKNINDILNAFIKDFGPNEKALEVELLKYMFNWADNFTKTERESMTKEPCTDNVHRFILPGCDCMCGKMHLTTEMDLIEKTGKIITGTVEITLPVAGAN